MPANNIDNNHSNNKNKNKHKSIRQYGAKNALLALTAINFLNFADRYVPSAVKYLIQEDLKLSDFQTSLPSTGGCLRVYICHHFVDISYISNTAIGYYYGEYD